MPDRLKAFKGFYFTYQTATRVPLTKREWAREVVLSASLYRPEVVAAAKAWTEHMDQARADLRKLVRRRDTGGRAR